MYFDGVATKWADQVEAKPDHPVGEYFEAAEDRDLTVRLIGGTAIYQHSAAAREA